MGQSRALAGDTEGLAEHIAVYLGYRAFRALGPEPFGQTIGKSTDGIGFTGHVSDSSSGLVYMQQRHYDPQIGRFLSTDPVAASSDPAGMFNRYRYAANNPYSVRDPDGRQECPSCEISYGAGVALAIGDDKQKMDTWRKGEAAATVAGSGAEEGATLGEAINKVFITGQMSNEQVKTLAMVAVVGVGMKGKSSGGAMHGPSPRIHMGKDGKHKLGHNNYEPGRSILTADPAELGRHAGTGQQVGNVRVGLPGSKERVNFGRTIVTYVGVNTGTSAPTSNGIISYSKDGIHIWPVRP